MAQLGAIWADGVWNTAIWNTAIWDQSSPSDSTPDQFNWTDAPGTAQSALNVTSNTVTLSGFTAGTAQFTESGHTSGEYSLNGGIWTDLGDVAVVDTDTLAVRLDASADFLTEFSINVTIGAVSDRFSVITIPDPSASVEQIGKRRAARNAKRNAKRNTNG